MPFILQGPRQETDTESTRVWKKWIDVGKSVFWWQRFICEDCVPPVVPYAVTRRHAENAVGSLWWVAAIDPDELVDGHHLRLRNFVTGTWTLSRGLLIRRRRPHDRELYFTLCLRRHRVSPFASPASPQGLRSCLLPGGRGRCSEARPPRRTQTQHGISIVAELMIHPTRNPSCGTLIRRPPLSPYRMDHLTTKLLQ